VNELHCWRRVAYATTLEAKRYVKVRTGAVIRARNTSQNDPLCKDGNVGDTWIIVGMAINCTGNGITASITLGH